MKDRIKNIFRRNKRNKSYSDVKRELEVREEIYSRMANLSDAQLDKWVKTKLKLQELKSSDNAVVNIVR